MCALVIIIVEKDATILGEPSVDFEQCPGNSPFCLGWWSLFAVGHNLWKTVQVKVMTQANTVSAFKQRR